MTLTISKTRLLETLQLQAKETPDYLPVGLIRENSIVGLSFDIMTRVLYGKHTSIDNLESLQAIRSASRLMNLGFDETVVSAMLCHKLIRFSAELHLKTFMEIAENTNYTIAKITEESSYLPNTETPEEYLEKLSEYMILHWQVFAVIGGDWENTLINIQANRDYRPDSEITLMTELLPSIQKDWLYWKSLTPTCEHSRVETIWENIFLLANETEII